MPVSTRRVLIHIAEALNHARREDLAVRLEHQPGIRLALPVPDDPHGVMVEYDPERFSDITLQDFFSLHGVHGRVVAR